MAERDLSTLLSTLQVEQHEGVWRFETIPADQTSWVELVNLKDTRGIAMLFQEREGLTVVTKAKDDTPEDNRWAWLELTVYSDLQAVGFLARVAAALSESEIPCNAVAAFHHDHIFVPETRGEDAIEAILALRPGS